MATSGKVDARSSQQWAWEFLRRNPTYRDAFRKLAALPAEHRLHISMCDGGVDDERGAVETIVRQLDVQFFDMSRMTGFNAEQRTIGDYLDQSQKLRDRQGEDDLCLTVAKKFRLGTYSLSKWYDPSTEVASRDVAGMWKHEIPKQFGLSHVPAADRRQSIDEQVEETGWLGYPPLPARIGSTRKIDKRLRKSPVQGTAGMTEIFRGSDGRAFARSGSTVPDSLTATQVYAVFDLALPVDFQLDSLRMVLENHQRILVDSGFVQNPPKHVNKFGAFAQYLEILDMLDAGMSSLEIAKRVDGVTTVNDWVRDAKANKLVKVERVVGRSKLNAPINELTQAVRKKIERALSLRDSGYRGLAFNR